MAKGLNQELRVLGRTFHFQTELTHERGLFVRIEVFLGGRIVATRESELECSPRDEPAVDSELRRKHDAVVQSFMGRAENFAKAQQMEGHSRALTLPDDASPPTAEMQLAAKTPLRIRQMLRKFRELSGTNLRSSVDPEIRLRKALQGFQWIVACSTMTEMRIDEQVRIHIVKDLVEEWIKSSRTTAGADQVWTEIIALDTYLTQVNQRQELAQFDRQLIAWALQELSTGDMTDELADRLALLEGRDDDLDRLMSGPRAREAARWRDELKRLASQDDA